MKKLLLALVLMVPMVLVGCNKKGNNKSKIIETESLAAIQKQLINGESLTLDSIKIIKDSIPFILDVNYAQAFDDLNIANTEFIKVRDSYGYSEEEKFKYIKKVTAAASKFYDMQDSLKISQKDYGYVALVNISAKNTAGANQTEKAVVIFTDTVTFKPTGCFVLSSEYTQKIWDMLNVDEDVSLKYNKYGTVDTDSLNPIIGFILDGQRLK